MSTLLRKFKLFLETTQDIFAHAIEYGHLLDNQKAINRLKTCNKCQYFMQSTQQCNRCGCFMFMKARLAATKCPENKWENE